MVTCIEIVANPPPTNDSSGLRTKEEAKQYIEKLIEYIGKCGKPTVKTRTIKYLLMSFIQVLSIAGKDQLTPRGKFKAKERITVSLRINISLLWII